MRANWFIAFPFPGAFLRELPPPPALFRLFMPEDAHVTLSFFGGCSEAAALRGFAALEATLASTPRPPLLVSLAEVVPMGPKRDYSALSALLARGREETERYLSELRDVVSDAAIGRRERRPPKPHVTLARPGRRATAEARQAGLDWAAALNLSGVEARLERLALYTWSEGNRHERLFRIVVERALS
jgi:2'-5' RNA ligase